MPLFGPEQSVLDQGLDAFAAKRWKKARRLLEDATVEELPRSLGDYHLGLLYWRGLGGERDEIAAVNCFRRAAESGHAAAQTALGLALLAGVGAERDVNQARALFRSAAGAGDVDAMLRLAAMSEPAEARDLLHRAAEGGHVEAMRQYANALMETDPQEALAWLYASVGMSGDAPTADHGAALARELSADEIVAAQKRGRAILKHFRKEQRRR